MIRNPGKSVLRGLQEMAANAKTYGPRHFGLVLGRLRDRDKKTWQDIENAIRWVETYCQEKDKPLAKPEKPMPMPFLADGI